MKQMELCKYLARELGEVLKDDEAKFHARIGNCYCVILADKWTTRRMRGRRVTTGVSAIEFLRDVHQKSGIGLSAIEAAIIVSKATKAIQAGSVS